MPASLSSYLPVALALGVAGALGLALVLLTSLLGGRLPTATKESTFECGSEPAPGTARQRFSVKFYVVALLFIVFDIETVFLYPWAVLFKELGWFGFAEMALFVFTLVIGLAYVWRKGALEWE